MLSWGRVLPLSLRARKLFHEKYFAISSMWLKLFPEKKMPSAFGGEWFFPMRNSTTALGVWKLFPSSYFWRNFSLMKYRLKWKYIYPWYSRRCLSTMYLGLCSMHSRRHLPICWLWGNVTALQKKFDALVVSLGGRQMERGSSIKVADTHVVPHEHVPAI